jgi:Na+-transporting methylmalonyl-CoA/oxaloacetate decarboxylase gamma subunit
MNIFLLLVILATACYNMRRILTEFFVIEIEAEQNRDSLEEILDNLPDAVLMLESN